MSEVRNSGAKEYLRRRLSRREIWLVKYLGRNQAAGLDFLSLNKSERKLAIPLWRERLVEIWYRQFADVEPSLSRPHFRLSATGKRLFQVLQERIDASRVPTTNTKELQRDP